MDFRYLKAFYLTAKSGSFSQAARSLRIAQSAVSRQVRLLEEDLGLQLLVRGSLRAHLTSHGETLFKKIADFSDWADQYEAQKIQLVRIAAMEGVASRWLPNKIARLENNDINIEITICTPMSGRALIEEAKVDLVLSTEKIESAVASSVILFREAFEIISVKPIKLTSLQDQRWIYVDQASHLRRVSKVSPKNFFKTGSLPALIELVRRGKGVAVIASHLLPEDTRGLVRTPLEKMQHGAIYLTSLNYSVMPQGVAEVRRLLLADREKSSSR